MVTLVTRIHHIRTTDTELVTTKAPMQYRRPTVTSNRLMAWSNPIPAMCSPPTAIPLPTTPTTAAPLTNPNHAPDCIAEWVDRGVEVDAVTCTRRGLGHMEFVASPSRGIAVGEVIGHAAGPAASAVDPRSFVCSSRSMPSARIIPVLQRFGAMPMAGERSMRRPCLAENKLQITTDNNLKMSRPRCNHAGDGLGSQFLVVEDLATENVEAGGREPRIARAVVHFLVSGGAVLESCHANCGRARSPPFSTARSVSCRPLLLRHAEGALLGT